MDTVLYLLNIYLNEQMTIYTVSKMLYSIQQHYAMEKTIIYILQ